MQLELALALAAFLDADAFELLHEAVATADTPIQRGTIALAGARACGLAGHFDDAIALSRSGLEAGAAIPPDLQARLEAELIADAWLQAATVPEARERLRRVAASPPPLALWRINAAWAGRRRRAPGKRSAGAPHLRPGRGRARGRPRLACWARSRSSS